MSTIRQKFTVTIDPEDALIIAYLSNRSSREGNPLSQTSVIRRVLSTALAKIRDSVQSEVETYQEELESTGEADDEGEEAE